MIGQVKFSGLPAVSVMHYGGYAMARRTIFVAFGLSFLLVSLTIFSLTRSDIKKQPLLVNAAVQQSQADPSGIPPGLWIEYDPVAERYTYCYDNSGVRSCSRDFISREHAIRDAQLFAKYLKRTGSKNGV